jgi:actin-related protein
MDTDAILRTAPTQYARYYAGSLRGAGYALVIDNGAYSSKFGYSDSPTPSRMIPNCISKSKKNKKKIVGEDIFECKDFSALNQSRPFDRVPAIN